MTAPPLRDDLVAQPLVGARPGKAVAATDDADGRAAALQGRGVGRAVDAHREPGHDGRAKFDQARADLRGERAARRRGPARPDDADGARSRAGVTIAQAVDHRRRVGQVAQSRRVVGVERRVVQRPSSAIARSRSAGSPRRGAQPRRRRPLIIGGRPSSARRSARHASNRPSRTAAKCAPALPNCADQQRGRSPRPRPRPTRERSSAVALVHAASASAASVGDARRIAQAARGEHVLLADVGRPSRSAMVRATRSSRWTDRALRWCVAANSSSSAGGRPRPARTRPGRRVPRQRALGRPPLRARAICRAARMRSRDHGAVLGHGRRAAPWAARAASRSPCRSGRAAGR